MNFNQAGKTSFVSEQSEDLRKFQLAVEGASDHIVITDPDGIILFANAGVTKVTGFPHADLMGKKAGTKKLWGGLMEKKFYEKLWKTIKTDKRPFKGIVKNRRKDGQEYLADVNISPVLDEKGNVRYFVGIERDVTKEKEIDRMKSEFISLASHQMRTPLSSIKWTLELLLGGDLGELNEKQIESLSNMNDANERMIELVNNLLNISRIESGRIIIKPEFVDLELIIKNLGKELGNDIRNRKHKFTVKIDPAIKQVWTDPLLLSNVYSNLLKNSIKYTPENGTITLEVKKENDFYITTITDNGYGIPESEHKKVFSRFYRGKNILSKQADGSGLGLYIIKQIVDVMSGQIWFESKENQGTRFFIKLPIQGLKEKKGEVRLSQ